MLTRALIVVLAVLNVGVALWWMSRNEAPPPRPHSEAGVAGLQLLPSPPDAGTGGSAAAIARTAPEEAAQAWVAAAPEGSPPPKHAADPVAAPRPTPEPEQCLSLGPFAERASAQTALAQAGSAMVRPRLREVAGSKAGSYRVWIAPAGSREAAQAMAKRIVDAGFSDYYIIAQGDEANAVALGQYRNREGAERRLASLVAAGFPASLAPGADDAPASWWIDTAIPATSSPAAVLQRSGAARQQSLDCARLR
ncbi:SPOR domain-containing protein [Stenotrophomonas sp. YIM B06876]|uniref:SPOR domain-containing protein n=1 Tax=Stenotrophomonas sp. YIM B06876 TaxID=3060211 RepID=UPI002738D077|nr:SPOR domain-containing protein [Stenotrophomonas sp. YIM B06876]